MALRSLPPGPRRGPPPGGVVRCVGAPAGGHPALRHLRGLWRAAHDGFSSVNVPVELTASTTGPATPNAIAVTEHGEMTMRWNRSSGVPTASATAALMGSA